MTKDEALRLALDWFKCYQDKSMSRNNAEELANELITTIKAALEAKDEPVAWKWHQAPAKTQWGHEMVVADIAIDKNHTASIYCEHDQTAKVEAMFSTPQQRKRLTDEEIDKAWRSVDYTVPWDQHRIDIARAIEAKLKEKNT